jgi:hypothetical protein
MGPVARLTICAASASWTFVAGNARATDASEKDQCIGAADQGQQLRDDNKYQLAREAFVRCARESCPQVVRQDCTQWVRDIEERTPTVLLRAEDGRSNDLVDVKVKLDELPLVSALDGKPVTVDPGEHVFKFEAGGPSSAEQHVVISAGEKGRLIVVRLEAAASIKAQASSVEVPAGRERPEPGPPGREIPLPVWIFGGAAAAAFASEAYFGIAGLSSRSSDLAAGGCAPNCPSSEKSAIQTEFAIADVSLGVGLVSAGLAAYFFFSSRNSTPSPTAATVDFSTRPGGAVATVGGKF